MDIRVGISEDIGFRDRMEDEHAVYRVNTLNFFSAEVYDGHGGRTAAQAAAEMLTPHFLDAWRRELDKSLRNRRKEEILIRDAYLATDRYIIDRGTASGTAAATLYVIADRFIAANAGDARIVIGTAEGALALTVDHRPDLQEERERIESMGGSVMFLDLPRVLGLLAMSRALGDRDFKPYVTAEPRVAKGWLGRENDYVVVACDGVWDVLDNDEVVELVRRSGDVQRAAEMVRESARDARSTDNITVVVIDLREHTAALKQKKMRIAASADFAQPNRARM